MTAPTYSPTPQFTSPLFGADPIGQQYQQFQQYPQFQPFQSPFQLSYQQPFQQPFQLPFQLPFQQSYQQPYQQYGLQGSDPTAIVWQLLTAAQQSIWLAQQTLVQLIHQQMQPIGYGYQRHIWQRQPMAW